MPELSAWLKQISIGKLLTAAGIIIGAVLLWLVLKHVYSHYVGKAGSKSRLARITFSLLRTLLVTIVILMILDLCGVNITSAVAGLGIVSAVVGLALQDILKDAIMGLHILSDHFFEVGDCVEINGEEGIVRRFTMKSTRIERLLDGSVVSFCNRNIEQARILSRLQYFDIPLAYTTDAETARAALEAASRTIAQTEGFDDCQFLGTQDFASSAILYKMCIAGAPEHKFALRRRAFSIIQDELAAAGIVIPFNQLDVHLDSH
ncbi:MAG: mechanosensitive ion channel family protein [Clostridia bacterium]|nr:mechanosensitive ion channel family protein [Clostridia bacterium]